jgi:bleomycin hydrolase
MFTGVDVSAQDGSKTLRWRVENSWGDANAEKGFYTMNDNWYDEYMFEIASPRSFLSADMLRCLDEASPIVLPAWDPMGSLAKTGATVE